jgi:hypothetical protein
VVTEERKKTPLNTFREVDEDEYFEDEGIINKEEPVFQGGDINFFS